MHCALITLNTVFIYPPYTLVEKLCKYYSHIVEFYDLNLKGRGKRTSKFLNESANFKEKAIEGLDIFH